MNRLPETNKGVVTSWIPIPTAQPHKAGCEKLLWQYVPQVIAGWDPGYGLEVDTNDICLPKPVTTWWLQDRLGPTQETIFSLGPVTCPQDYYTATESAQDSTSTFVACCPINYGLGNILGPGRTGQCTSVVKKGDVLTYAQRDTSGWKTTTSTVSADTTVDGIQVNGWAFATPTGATTSAGNCEASVTEALANHIATGNSSCEATGSSGISSGAAAGIGVGVSLGVTGLAALGAGLFMMYRTRKAARRTPKNPDPAADIAHFANSDKKGGMGASAQVYPTYSPVPQDASNPYENSAWGGSSSYVPPSSKSNTHTNARTVPHGEMEGTTYQNADELSRGRSEMDAGTIVTRAPSHQDSEERRKRMELEGEFDRNVKVSLSTPWLATARPVQPPPSSHYQPPY